LNSRSTSITTQAKLQPLRRESIAADPRDRRATNERINQVLIDLLDAEIWRKQPPSSKRRNIATTFAHIHNGRRMRIGMSRQGHQ